MWATVLPSLASHRGGTLTVIAQLPPDEGSLLPTDPAVAYYAWAWQMLSMTNDGLVGYRRFSAWPATSSFPTWPPHCPGRPTAADLHVPAPRGHQVLNRSAGQAGDFRRAIERVLMIDKHGSGAIPPSTPGSSAPPVRTEPRPLPSLQRDYRR